VCDTVFIRQEQEKLCSDDCRKYIMTEDKIKEYRKIILECSPTKIGWVTRAGQKIKLSRTAIRNFTDKYCIDMDLYKRKERK